MRRLLPLLVIPACIVACADSSGEQQVKVQRSFDSAMTPLRQAQRGYVPGKELTTGTGDAARLYSLRVYRQEQQGKAATALEELTKQADKSLGSAAKATMASIDDSAGRELLSQAVTNWAVQVTDKAMLPSYLEAVNQADGWVRRYEVDRRAALAQLNKGLDDAKAQLTDYVKEMQQWDARVAALTPEIAKFKAQAEAAETAGGALRTKALTAPGDEGYALYDQAGAKAKEASTAGAEMQKRVMDLDIANSNRAIVQKQVDLRTEGIKAIEGQITAVRARNAELAGKAAEARKAKDEAVQRLEEATTKAVGDFEREVTKRFQEADGRLNKAVTEMAAAVDGATGTARRQLEIELLAARAGRLNLLSLEALANVDLYETLNLLAQASGQQRGADTLMPQKVVFYQRTAKDVIDRLAVIVTDADKSLDEAGAQATKLNPTGPGDPVYGLSEVVKSYKQQIDDVRAALKDKLPATPERPISTPMPNPTTSPTTAPATAPGQ